MTMAAINRYCPRSGKPVAQDSLAPYRGLTVGFCNPGCRDDFVARTAECEADRRYFDALIHERGLDREGRLPTIEGERVRLRWLEASDVDAIHAVFSDPAAMRYWSHEPFKRIEQAHDYLESIRHGFLEDRLFQWGVARRGDDAVLGTVTLAQIDRANRRAEIGFALAPAHWGQGYGREAVALALAHAYGALALARIGADVDPRNTASLRLLESLGFRREGHVRESWRVGGEVQDSILLARLASDGPPPDAVHGASSTAHTASREENA
jgi:RimJ/RimL family protein N-acetyltransferase